MIDDVLKLYDIYPDPPESIPDRLPPGYNGCGYWQSLDRSGTGMQPLKPNIRILEAAGGRGWMGQYLDERHSPRFVKLGAKKSAISILNQAVKIIN